MIKSAPHQFGLNACLFYDHVLGNVRNTATMVICKLGWPVGVNLRANNEGYDGSQTSKAR